MIPALGVCCNDYASVYVNGGPIPALRCPTCERLLRAHGWHWRFVDGQLKALRRVRCFPCHRTHVVLPADLCAYRDATLPSVEAALAVGRGHPTSAARAAGVQWERDETAEAVRKVRRWFLGFDARFEQQVLALLPAAEGTWLERARQAFGSQPGTLVRLRAWLWERHRVLLLGPTGLRRHGRARDGVHRASTDLCIVTDPPDTS